MLPNLSPRLLKTSNPPHALALRTHITHRLLHRLAPASASASVSASPSLNVHRVHLSTPRTPISIASFHTHNRRTTPALPRAAPATPTPHRLSTPSLASYIRFASQAAEQSISYVYISPSFRQISEPSVRPP